VENSRHKASLQSKSELNSKKSETHIPDAPKSKHAFFHNSTLNNEYYFDKRFCSLSKLVVKSKNISFDAPNINLL